MRPRTLLVLPARAPQARPARRVLRGPSLLLVLSSATSACYDRVTVPDFETDGRLSIMNDEGALAARVTYANEDVPIVAPPAPAGSVGPLGAGAGAGPAGAPTSVTLTLVAEIDPPTIAGAPVQATSVWATRNDRAVVSYNLRGPLARGAIDYFTDLDTRRPRLRSSVQFADADVSSVFVDDSWVYAAAASENASLAAPAVLERVELSGTRFRTTNSARVVLSSFAGTSALSTGARVYATSGNTGHVFAFAASNLALLGRYALDDARWVAWDEQRGRIVVLQGTPGRLAVFAEGSFPGGSLTPLAAYPVPGVDVPESKSTVEIHGGKAFVAAGPAGVQVVCLDNGAVVGSVPRPDPASLGLDPAVVVTNAVTVEDDLMFISNGEAGVYAAVGATSFETSACNAPQTITVLGRLRFGNLQSANHVVLRKDLLFVAAGTGGVKVVDVRVR